MDKEITFGKHYCGRKWNRCEIALAVVAVLLVVIVVILAIVLGTQAKKDDQPAQRTVLRNEIYTAQAGRIMSNMNASVDPCTDFWNYACGGYIANTKAPADGSSIDLFTQLSLNIIDQLNPYASAPIADDDIDSVRKMKLFYQSCIDTDTIASLDVQPMRDTLESLGGWPMIEENWSPDASFDRGEFMIDLMRMNGFTLSALQIFPDPLDNSNNRVLINPVSVPLAAQLLSTDAADVAVIDQYASLAKEMATKIYGGTDAGRLAQIDREVDEAIAFEKEIARTVHTDDKSTLYQAATAGQGLGISTVGNLTSTAPQVWDWLAFLNYFIAPDGSTLTPEDLVLIVGLDYYENLNAAVQPVSDRVFVNYLLLASASRSWPALTAVPELVSLSTQIISLPAMVTPAPAAPKSAAETVRYCTQLTNELFGNVLSRFFVRDYTPPDVVEDVSMLGDYLRASFKNIIIEAHWMDEATRAKALLKLENMPVNVAYDENILDDVWLNEQYEARVINNGSYFLNILSILRADSLRQSATLTNPAARTSWSGTPTTVNAIYIRNKNTVEINAAILQQYSYHLGYPKFLIFGSLGVFVGHELTHGFDTGGSDFNELGNLVNWWTPAIREAFDERTQCMAEQYTEYGLPDYGLQVDGQLTLAENIADNGGMKESFEAYQSWVSEQDEVEPSLPGFEHMSNEQMFFLSWAQLWCVKDGSVQSLATQYVDVHSPKQWRALGVPRNYAGFAAAYNCPSGSYMNPSQRCPVW